MTVGLRPVQCVADRGHTSGWPKYMECSAEAMQSGERLMDRAAAIDGEIY
jgi:hypothetical protein